MNDSQSIKASSNSSVVQSGRDTNIGFSADEMRQVIECVADQLPKFALMADELVERRLDRFEERIVARFESDSQTRPEAFGDPDFQFTLGRAQHAYARSGEENIEGILVDLIAQRSKESSRTRRSLILNDAIEKSAYLTENEFAQLSLAFYVRHTQVRGLNTFEGLVASVRRLTEPLLDSISRDELSYSYLEAQACGSVDDLRSVDFLEVLRGHYGGVMSRGAPLSDFEQVLGPFFQNKYRGIVGTCLHAPENFQAMSMSEEVLKAQMKAFSVEEKSAAVWEVHKRGFFNNEEFIAKASILYPRIAELFDLWSNTPLKSLKLTAVGIAIGYANLSRMTPFRADLGIWIK